MEDNIRQLFTVTIFSENCVGILNQVSIIFTRRGLNIEDVSASRTSMDGIHRLTLTVWSDLDTMQKVVGQIEKRIDVIRAFLYTDSDIIYQEIALYKVDTKALMADGSLEKMIRRHNARIIDFTPDFTVIEKSGHPFETEALLNELQPYGLRQFVRSGRVCVTNTPEEHLNNHLAQQIIRRHRTLGE